MGACPYCHQAEISERSSARLWADFIAKALGQVRIFFEVREQPNFGIKKLLKALVDSDSLPLASKQDRLCPFCRRGYVTRKSADSIWLDLCVRLMGMGRTYLELRGNREDFPIRELALVIVEGDVAKVPTDNGFSDFTVEVTDPPEDEYKVEDEDEDDEDVVYAEAVDSTPFDKTDDDDGEDTDQISNDQDYAGF